MNIDHRLSHGFFNLARSHWVGRHLAILAGTHLIWLMLGLLIGVTAWDSQTWAQTWTFPPGTETLLLLILLLPAWGVTLLLSKFVNRARPFEELKQQPLIAPFVRTASFPSAHATFAFSMVILTFISPMPTLSICLLIGAILVSLGRVAAGLHFFSDVLCGALVGLAVTLYAVPVIMIVIGQYD